MPNFKFILTLLLFLIVLTEVNAQELFVWSAKKAKLSNNKKLEEGKSISTKEYVTIGKNGYVRFGNKTGWQFSLYDEGRYNIDSCYQYYKKIYASYDSVYSMIQIAYPDGLGAVVHWDICRTCFYRAYEEYEKSAGNLYFEGVKDYKLEILKPYRDTCSLSWVDPTNKSKRFFIVISNLFEEVVDYQTATSNKLTLDLSKTFYKRDSIFLITIYSDDKRKSDQMWLCIIPKKK